MRARAASADGARGGDSLLREPHAILGGLQLRLGYFGGSRVGIELLLRDLGLSHQRAHARQVRLRLFIIGFRGSQIGMGDGYVRGGLRDPRIRLRRLRLGGVQARGHSGSAAVRGLAGHAAR